MDRYSGTLSSEHSVSVGYTHELPVSVIVTHDWALATICCDSGWGGSKCYTPPKVFIGNK